MRLSYDFFFQAEDGIRDVAVTGVQTCALPISLLAGQIFDESGGPVRHARITLYQENHAGGLNRIMPVGTALTDDRGSYEFPSLAPGNYFVSVAADPRSEEHTSELQSRLHLVCRLLLDK